MSENEENESLDDEEWNDNCHDQGAPPRRNRRLRTRRDFR